ncbi:MAG: hypothetical protein RR555_04255 [Bacteroidales bacterium]
MGFLTTKEKKIGFYSTVIFHLLMIIGFLLTGIHGIIREETSFVLDFTKQEELEQMDKVVQMKEQASKEIDDILSGRAPDNQYRNVAVDRSSKALKDDRFKNPNQVYDEAKALQKKLDASRREAMKEQGADDAVSGESKESNNKVQTYKGPSVISYSLDGRKSISLPVPVYKCYGGGDVSVRILVNKKGYVVDAQVIDSVSAPDDCIRRYAVDAAKRSRFTASASAPDKQAGEIVYRFIAQ